MTRCNIVMLMLATPALLVVLIGCNETSGDAQSDTAPTWDSVGEISIDATCEDDVECDDDDPCTVDICTDGSCLHTSALDITCDDGNPCTVGDQCTGDGICAGSESADCDDGNPCTIDGCDPVEGCTHVVKDGPTECDGSLCTQDDTCQAGDCVGGEALDCADPDPDDCVELLCNATTGECDIAKDLPAGHPCLDVNPCTDDDACDAAGICEGGPTHNCASQHPCKTAWCNESAKEGTNPCVLDFLPEETPCDDGSLCTDADSCTPVGDVGALQCQGVPLSCDDGNSCTLDTCHEETGCAFQDKSDGTACATLQDETGTCQSGTCIPTGAGCDDGVACTLDEPGPGGECVYTPDDGACDDGIPCNGLETCDAVQGCLAGGDADCDDEVACTVDTCDDFGCVYTPDDGACDDGNPCTANTCDPAAGCVSTFVAPACNDNNVCTTGDVCFQGQCTGGAAVNCDDQDPCTIDSCDPIQGCYNESIQCGGECVPYAIETCYPGPGGTAGLGACKAGYRQCLTDGSDWSPCYGAVVPEAGDLCGNGLDDDCDGTQTDEVCDGGAAGVWVDWDNGDDDLGNGSWDNPYRTISKGISVGVKLVNVRADADGTVYQEYINMSFAQQDIVVRGYGPTRPVLEGVMDIVHCYDCTIENMELRYPPAGYSDPMPQSVIDAVHNYRNTFRDILLTAPHGLPAGKDLARCHHGYDNLFEEVVVDQVVLQPSADSASFQFLNWNDHGSGSQFIRCSLGDDLSVDGVPSSPLSVHFIRVGGYCGTYPDGVSAIRNCLVGDLDLDAFGAPSSTFYGFRYWCYTPSQGTGGIMIANNTLGNISATTVQGVDLSISGNMAVKVSGNILGPFYGTTEIGVASNVPVEVTWSDLWDVTVPVQNSATVGAGVLTVDPMFAAPAQGDFHLSPGSPCENTGEPSWLDPDGTPADMGAYGGPFAE